MMIAFSLARMISLFPIEASQFMYMMRKMAMPTIAASVTPPISAIFMANRLACTFLEACTRGIFVPPTE
jgi:hypothetical protein